MNGFWAGGWSAYMDGLKSAIRELEQRLDHAETVEERESIEVDLQQARRQFREAQFGGARLLF